MTEIDRTLVIGLDGADLDLIRPWIEAGELPVLGSFLTDGASGYLESTIPPVSAPAWASFMTGRSPGRHGLFGFVSEVSGSGETVLANLSSIHGEKLWDLFGRAGRRVVTVNVPISWPPPEVNGAFVSGMLTPPGRRYTWPDGLQDEIEREFPGYRIDIDRSLFRDKEQFLAHLSEVASLRADLVKWLMDRTAWDLFVAVFTNTDRLQHHFWNRKDDLLAFYRRIDRWVGEILAKTDPERTLTLVVSDHGFTGTDRRFYANRWLMRQGYLKVRRTGSSEGDYTRRNFNWFMGEPEEERHKPERIGWFDRLLGRTGERRIDWTRTRAYLYSSDSRGIQISLAGRSPVGIVDPEDYEPLRTEIISKLSALRFPGTGEPVFERVVRREEVYDGPFVADAPDIVMLPTADRYRVVTKIDPGRVLRQHANPTGYHRKEGLLLAKGPGVRPGTRTEGARLIDVMPTLLFAAGIPIPEGADGRVLRGLFRESYLKDRRERREPDRERPAAERTTLTPEEDEILRCGLRDLGYL